MSNKTATSANNKSSHNRSKLSIEQMIEMATSNKYSMKEIANICGISRQAVYAVLKRRNISIPKEVGRPYLYRSHPAFESKEALENYLKEYNSFEQVAKEIGCSMYQLNAWRDYYKIDFKFDPLKGHDNPGWKGGISFNKENRCYLNVHESNYLKLNPKYKHRSITRYRFVAEAHLGFPIPKGYVVHHINEDSLDDRVENLAILTHSQHQRIHRYLKTIKKDYLQEQLDYSDIPIPSAVFTGVDELEEPEFIALARLLSEITAKLHASNVVKLQFDYFVKSKKSLKEAAVKPKEIKVLEEEESVSLEPEIL